MTQKSKKPGRPKKYANSAERVAAYRKRQNQAGGTRFDIFLSIEASAKVMHLSAEHGCAASKVIEALILADSFETNHSCSNRPKRVQKIKKHG